MRFINMLRMFKVTSSMSMGSWILTASGATTTLAAVNAWTGLFPRMARLTRPAAATFGLPLSTYTAALIADTAVPVWHQAHHLLPFVYGSGAALSAGGAGVAVTPTADAAAPRRLAIGAALIEVGAKELRHRRLGEHGEPYKQGSAALFGRVSRACNLGGAAMLFRWGARCRPAAIAGGALLCAGALSARFSTFRAGYQSAADPRYVVGPQRAGIERGDRPGAARRESKVREHDPALGSPATAPAELSAS